MQSRATTRLPSEPAAPVTTTRTCGAIAGPLPYDARMSGDPATGPAEDDPFKGLEGLGEDLEDTFAELDKTREDKRPSGESRSGESRSDERRSASGEPGGFGGLGELLKALGDTSGLGALFGDIAGGPSDKTALESVIGKRARDISRAMASGGDYEPNVDPTDRIALGSLMRVAELRVANATGLDPARGHSLQAEAVNRTLWADRTVRDYLSLFRAMGESMLSNAEQGDPVANLFSAIGRMLGPTMISIRAGSLVGTLAQRALGSYVLPVPRPAFAPVMVVLRNVDKFARQWALPVEDVRLWVCLHEAVHHAVFGVEHIRERLSALLQRYAAASEGGADRLSDLLGGIDTSRGPERAFADVQALLTDPEELWGAVRSPAQQALLPALAAPLAAVAGYADHVIDGIGAELIGRYDKLSEALRRHRVEIGASDRLSERVLGLELDQAHYDRGSGFAAGVVERAGPSGLNRLFDDPANLPTPAEVDAPGLWLARINLRRGGPAGR